MCRVCGRPCDTARPRRLCPRRRVVVAGVTRLGCCIARCRRRAGVGVRHHRGATAGIGAPPCRSPTFETSRTQGFGLAGPVGGRRWHDVASRRWLGPGPPLAPSAVAGGTTWLAALGSARGPVGGRRWHDVAQPLWVRLAAPSAVAGGTTWLAALGSARGPVGGRRWHDVASRSGFGSRPVGGRRGTWYRSPRRRLDLARVRHRSVVAV